MFQDRSKGFTKVKLCEEEDTGRMFAMKVFRKLPLRGQREFLRTEGGMKVRTSLDKVYDELNLMKEISHPNCIRLIAIFDEEHENGKIYAVMELVDAGPVMEWYEEDCRFRAPEGPLIPETTMRIYLSDLLVALSYLHGRRIAHRDVKPQNLLMESPLKLGDFSVATRMDEEYLVHGTEGTHHFFSPEMCAWGYCGHDGRRADIWATGVCVWAFLLGTLPYWQKDLAALMHAIAFEPVKFPEPGISVSQSSYDLLAKLLCKDPAQRPLAEDLLLDELLNGEVGEVDSAALCQAPWF
eukprot:Skav204646  [mRNA]  locus=scaffold3135:62746:63633:- [translate_table: standard]